MPRPPVRDGRFLITRRELEELAAFYVRQLERIDAAIGTCTPGSVEHHALVELRQRTQKRAGEIESIRDQCLNRAS